MRDTDLRNSHLGWIAAWGVVVLVIAALISTVAMKASSPFTTEIWLVIAVFSVVGVFALYMTFSPILGKWPFGGANDDEREVAGHLTSEQFLEHFSSEPTSYADVSEAPTPLPEKVDSTIPVERGGPHSPKDLWKLCSGTSIQNDDATRRFLGDLVEVTGPVQSVSNGSGYGIRPDHVNVIVSTGKLSMKSIHLHFRNPALFNRLRLLNEGDTIHVKGLLESIDK